MGGAISDLVSRVNALEQNRYFYPDFSRQSYVVNLDRSTSEDIVPGWNMSSHPFDYVTVPSSGWIHIMSRVKNYDNNADIKNKNFIPRRITVSVKDKTPLADCIAGIGEVDVAIEDSDCASLIVKAGTIIQYGSNTANPNGYYSVLKIWHTPFQF